MRAFLHDRNPHYLTRPERLYGWFLRHNELHLAALLMLLWYPIQLAFEAYFPDAAPDGHADPQGGTGRAGLRLRPRLPLAGPALQPAHRAALAEKELHHHLLIPYPVAKNAILRLYLVSLFALLGRGLAWGQPSRLAAPPATRQANAARILAWERSKLGVREHDYNRGAEVESYQRTTGNEPGSEWCGSFQATANARCGLPFPAAAGGARYWFLLTSPRTYFVAGIRGSPGDIEPGDRVGFWSPSARRIGHIGCAETRTRNGFTTIEGNTKSGADAGVHRLRACLGIRR